MSKFYIKNSLFIRNIMIVYILVGIVASFLADFHQNYQNSLQGENANKFSRVISLGVAYQAKQILTSK